MSRDTRQSVLRDTRQCVSRDTWWCVSRDTRWRVSRDTRWRVSWDTQWCSWLRHCSASCKVMGSTPKGVTGIFHPHNPSSCTTALGSTQPLIEASTRNIYWGVKVAGASGWQPYYLHLPTVSKYMKLKFLEPCGPLTGLFWDCFTLVRGNADWRTVTKYHCFQAYPNSLTSEYSMPTFRNTLSVPPSQACRYEEWLGMRNVVVFLREKVWPNRLNRWSVLKRRHIKFRRRGITQKKAYNNLNLLDFSSYILRQTASVVYG